MVAELRLKKDYVFGTAFFDNNNGNGFSIATSPTTRKV